jgi:hypothetical protein
VFTRISYNGSVAASAIPVASICSSGLDSQVASLSTQCWSACERSSPKARILDRLMNKITRACYPASGHTRFAGSTDSMVTWHVTVLAPESHIHIEVPVFFRFPLAIPGQPERLSSLKRSRSISCLPPPRPLFAPQATVSSRQPCGFSRASSVLHRSRPILSALPFITLSSRKPFRVHAHIHFFLSASFSPSPFLSLHPAFCHLH